MWKPSEGGQEVAPMKTKRYMSEKTRCVIELAEQIARVGRTEVVVRGADVFSACTHTAAKRTLTQSAALWLRAISIKTLLSSG